MFILKDHDIYDETYDLHALASADKGTALQTRDVFGFWLTDVLVSTTIAYTFIYRARQVLADKKTGTGEEILALEKAYYIPSLDVVTANPTGTYGVDYYFCGWAKFDADASDDTVLINFDGTRWNENI